MKLAKLALPLLLALAASAHAEDYSQNRCKVINPIGNLLTDVVLVRPVGVIGTLAGGALFVGLSPLTALADIPEPHDAFQKMAATLVGIPYVYTFERPLGNFGSNRCF